MGLGRPHHSPPGEAPCRWAQDRPNGLHSWDWSQEESQWRPRTARTPPMSDWMRGLVPVLSTPPDLHFSPHQSSKFHPKGTLKIHPRTSGLEAKSPPQQMPWGEKKKKEQKKWAKTYFSVILNGKGALLSSQIPLPGL